MYDDTTLGGVRVLRKTVTQGVQTRTYLYDLLGRLVQVTTPEQGTTLNVYDTTTSPCANSKGDLVKSTDNAGNVACLFYDMLHRNTSRPYPSGPNSGTLSGLSGLPLWNFNVDGAGRINGVTPSAGQAPMTASSRNVFGEVTSATYGSLDSDTFTYGSAMGFMASYATTVNGTNTVSGTLSRALYGNVTQNIISDPLNPINSQTCNYVYDDLNRLASVTCPSKWSQTFTYDQYGNVSMSGSMSWLPGYNSANNRYTLAGVVYDANGFITTGPLGDIYAYDSSGNTTAINTNTYTYDALGRWVETKVGSTYTQMVYSPAGGKLALMNGQTPLKTFIGLPGGAQAVYSSTSLSYYRHSDWQGSSRLATTAARGLYFSTAYSPFGVPYGSSGTSDPKFAGNTQDQFASLYDTPARLDAPTQGRWLVPDPLGSGLNLYAYTGNDPVNRTDTSGLQQGSCTSTSTTASCTGDFSWPPLGPEQGHQGDGSGLIGASSMTEQLSSFTGVYVDYGSMFSPGGGLATNSSLRFTRTAGFGEVIPGQRLPNGDVAAGSMIQGILQGNRALWNSAAFMGNAAFIGSGAVLAAPVVVEAAASAPALANRALFGPILNRVFWSGGTAVGWRAAEWAESNAGATLEMSPAGKILSTLGGWAPSSWWTAASSSFAQGASGPVVVFQGSLLRLQPILNTWAAAEYSALTANGSSIIYVGVGW